MMQAQKNDGIMKKLMRKTSTLRRHHHRANDSTVTFHFKLHKSTEDFLNETILISGSIPELGSGNIEKAARMVPIDTADGRYWKYDLVVPVKELEHARMDIAGSYEGNPHGNFFTYNYVSKSKDSSMEKFEPIPRRGVGKSSLSTTNSLGKEDLIREFSYDHVWGTTSTPRGSILVSHRMVDSAKGLELKPSNSVPVMDFTNTARLTGKATADSSPTMAPRSANNRSSANLSSQPAPLSSAPAPLMDRSVSFMDRREDRQQLSKTMAPSTLMDAPVPSIHDAAVSPSPATSVSSSDYNVVDNKSKSKGMFSWYRSISKKSLSTIGSSRTERRHTVSGPEAARQAELAASNLNISVKYSDTKPEGSTYAPTRQTRAVSDFGPDAVKTLNIVDESNGEVVFVPVVETEKQLKIRQDESDKIIQQQLELKKMHDAYRAETPIDATPAAVPTFMDMSALPQVSASPLKLHKDLEQDPLTSVTSSKLSSSDFIDLAPAQQQELAYQNDEISEDVLLDRIEENTPLLASESSQFQDMDSVSSMNLNKEETSSTLSRSDVVDFTEFQAEPKIELSETRGVDGILSGKWHKVGLELKQKIGGDITWSQWLETRKPLRSSTAVLPSVDPVVYGKVHRLGLELKSKVNDNKSSVEFLKSRNVRMAALPAVDPIISGKMYRVGQDLKSKISNNTSAKEYLSARKARSAPLRSVDPIVSGRMYRVGQDLKSKIHDDVDFKSYLQSRRIVTPIRRVDPIYSGRMYKVGKQLKAKVNAGTWRPIRGFNAVLSGKLHNVHKELLMKAYKESIKQDLESMIPDVVQATLVPAPIEEENINKAEEIIIPSEKSISVFEEQMEKGLTHRKVHHEETPEVIVPEIRVADVRRVGYHATRDDFMPISHSASMMADSSSALSQAVESPRSYTPFYAFVLIVMWMFIFSLYFPESMLMEMSPVGVASTEVAQVLPEENLVVMNTKL